MAYSSPAPIGNSSGLFQTIESAAHARPKRAWVASVTGFATSLLLHGGILVVGILLLNEVPKLLPRTVEQDHAVGIEISPDNNTQLRNPFENGKGVMPDPSVATRGQLDGGLEQAMNSESFNQALDLQFTPTSTVIGVGTQQLTGLNTIGTGSNRNGKQLGQLDGVVKDRPISFIQGGPAGGPVASRVVFLCDATGTMTGLKFDLLKKQLNQTVGNLQPVQNFNIVLFADSGATAMNPSLAAGTPQNKRKAADFLQKFAPRGGTNPLPGVEMAFAMKPQVIFLLSDGEFDNLVSYDEVLDKIKTLNTGKNVRVYTILFGDRDPRAEQTLKTIAEDNGGVFRFVTTQDLLGK